MYDREKDEERKRKAQALIKKYDLKNFDDWHIAYVMEKTDEWNEKVEKGEVEGQKKTFSEKKLKAADEWITERDERAAKFFEELKNPEKLEPMFDYIRNLIGLPGLNFTVTVEEHQGKKYIEFESADIHDNFLIRNAWSEFRVSNFGGSLSTEKYDDGLDRYNPRETDLSVPARVDYWWNIDFSYEHWGSGTNGAEIATAWVDDKFNWTFRSKREEAEKHEAERKEMEARWKAIAAKEKAQAAEKTAEA